MTNMALHLEDIPLNLLNSCKNVEKNSNSDIEYGDISNRYLLLTLTDLHNKNRNKRYLLIMLIVIMICFSIISMEVISVVIRLSKDIIRNDDMSVLKNNTKY